MSSSRHPVALRLEGYVGGETKLLATVMALPLVDGIFAALVLGGALSDPVGVLEVGLLIFGGSATLAVILAEMRVTPRRGARAVLLVGTVLVVGAAVEAALAPTIEALVNIATFERFAALVIAAIAAKTASARIGEYLPGPGVVVGLGFLASVDPAGATLVVDPDPVLVGKAAAAAGVGTLFALSVALAGPRLRAVVDVDRFRFGSAVALGLLPLSILGLELGHAPLLVVAVAGLLAYDPDGTTTEATDAGDGRVAVGGLADAATAPAVADGGDATPADPGSVSGGPVEQGSASGEPTGEGSGDATGSETDPGEADGSESGPGEQTDDVADPDDRAGGESSAGDRNGDGSSATGEASRATDGERVPWF